MLPIGVSARNVYRMTATTHHIPTWTMADRMRKARMDAGLTQQEIAQ